MMSRSLARTAACLALVSASLVFCRQAAACPPLPPDAAAAWAIAPEAWAKACSDAKDPAQALRGFQVEFASACARQFPDLPQELVARACLQGVPGLAQLRALQASRSAEGQGPAAFRGPEAAGLQKLQTGGLDAGSLEGFYTGAASRPELKAGLGHWSQAPLTGKAYAAPKVELGSHVVVDPKLSPDEASFAQSILDRMQSCSEGRAILSGLVAESQAGKKGFTVAFRDYPGTEIVRKGDLEDIQGGEYGEASPADRTLYLNRALTRFRSREFAIDNAVGTAAHEMAHLWRHARVKRTMPEYYAVFDMDLGDEYGARLKGQLVGAQTHRGAATVDTEDARDVLSDPDSYQERMKLWSPVYAVSLDRSEMQDPKAAYRARLKALKTALEDQKAAQKELPLVLKRIRHFCEAHKEDDTCGRLAELKSKTEADIKTYPHDIKETKEAIEDVGDKLASLKTPEGRRLVKLLKRASADPRYRSLIEENKADLTRLRREASARALPERQKTPGQIDREGLEALVQGDAKHAKDL